MDLVQLIPSLKRLDCLSDAGCVYTTYNANVFFLCYHSFSGDYVDKKKFFLSY